MEVFNIVVGILGILSFVGMLVQYLYYHKIAFYMFIRKIVKRSDDVQFDVSFTYKIEKDSAEVFRIIESTLKEHYDVGCIKKEMNLVKHKIYNLEDFFCNVQLDDEINVDEESKELFITFPKIKATYKNAENTLEGIDLISQKLSRNLNILNEVYSMDIKYRKGNNPFFGQSIQRFGNNAVKSYTCQIHCKAIGKDDMEGKYANIYKEYVNITDTSFSVIRRLGLYLLLIR